MQLEGLLGRQISSSRALLRSQTLWGSSQQVRLICCDETMEALPLSIQSLLSGVQAFILLGQQVDLLLHVSNFAAQPLISRLHLLGGRLRRGRRLQLCRYLGTGRLPLDKRQQVRAVLDEMLVLEALAMRHAPTAFELAVNLVEVVLNGETSQACRHELAACCCVAAVLTHHVELPDEGLDIRVAEIPW